MIFFLFSVLISFLRQNSVDFFSLSLSPLSLSLSSLQAELTVLNLSDLRHAPSLISEIFAMQVRLSHIPNMIAIQ